MEACLAFEFVSCLTRAFRAQAAVRLCGKREISFAMNPADVRVGLGHDTHRLVPDRKFILGGVTIRFDRGLEGHVGLRSSLRRLHYREVG